MLENYLSSELETTVEVDKIDGNVVHVSTDDKHVSEVLQFLSDTGLLASMIQSKLDFKKEHFCFDKMMLKVKLIIPDTAKTEESESQTGNCKKIETDNKK